MLFLSKECDWVVLAEEPPCTVQAIAQGQCSERRPRLAVMGRRLRLPISQPRLVTVFQVEDLLSNPLAAHHFHPLSLPIPGPFSRSLDRSRGFSHRLIAWSKLYIFH